MSVKPTGPRIASAAAWTLLFVLVCTSCARNDSETREDGEQRRNITGVWERFPPDSLGPGTRRLPPETPVEPIHLKEPYASQYAAMKEKRAAALKAGAPLIDNSSRCLPEGMPKMMAAVYPIQIVQTPGQVIVLAEIFTQTRRIWMGEQMPPDDQIDPSFNGYSVGHWDGDTLVTSTYGIRTDADFFDIPHSEAFRVTERIRLVGKDVLENSITLEDPLTLATPYNFKIRYQKIDYKISEYFCESSNIVEDAEGRAIYDPKTIGPPEKQ